MAAETPPYFDQLIAGFHAGATGRFVHLGHWDEPDSVEPDSSPGIFEQAQFRMNEVLLDMAGLRNNLNVLDAGCGFGGTIEAVNASFRNMRLSGCNIDPRQLEICRQVVEVNNNRLLWLQADACRLPFPDASLDRVLCIEAMFHFPSRQGFFEEAARVLRQGGIMVATDIVLTDANGELSGTEIITAIRRGFGPWPDPWNEAGDHEKLGHAAGLVCTARVDATRNTRPSHLYTAPADVNLHKGQENSMRYAAAVLKWLHEGDRLRYLYLRFVKS